MKSKKEMMKRLREERVDQGLKRIEVWAKPKHEEKIRAFVASLT